jgi:hypothetical protein
MPRFSPAVRPEGINPLAVALGQVFTEFRDAPARAEEMDRRRLENIAREIEIARTGFVAGGQPPAVDDRARIDEGPKVVAEGPATSFDFSTAMPIGQGNDPRAFLRPRDRSAIGGGGLNVVGPDAEPPRRETFDALPAMLTPGDVRGIAAGPQELAQVVEQEAERQLSLPSGRGTVPALSPEQLAKTRIGIAERDELRARELENRERQIQELMAAAQAGGQPISRAEATIAAQNLNLPEGPFHPFGSAEEKIAHERKLSEARTEGRIAGGGGQEDLTVGERSRAATSLTAELIMQGIDPFEAASIARRRVGEPNLQQAINVAQDLQGGGGGGGEVPLTSDEVWVQELIDSGEYTPAEITSLIEDPEVGATEEEQLEMKRFLAESFDRNMPVRPRAAGRMDEIRDILGDVRARRGLSERPAAEESEIGRRREPVSDLRDTLGGASPAEREAAGDTTRRFLRRGQRQ